MHISRIAGILSAVLLLLAAPAGAVAGELAAKTVPVPGGIGTLIRIGNRILISAPDGGYSRVHLVSGLPVVEPLPNFTLLPPPNYPDMLPDGLIAFGDRDIAEAWLFGPTRRYRHGVIGDAIEAGGLRILAANGSRREFVLPADSVFEDRLARLADLDGDRQDEILVVRSYRDRGAALAVLKLVGEELQIVAETAPIGQPSRWLNPVGVGDFDGDGVNEVAIVVTPHIGGILEIYELTAEGLRLDGRADGFSNHAIGSRELGLSALLDENGDGVTDLAVPSADRRGLRVVTFAGGTFRELAVVAQESRIATAIHAVDLDANGRRDLVYGLAGDKLAIAVR